jgi:hypothetical protein
MEENLRGEHAARAKEILGIVMEDPNSETEQSGLLKKQGDYTVGYFRSLKTYFLSNPDAKTVVRIRSIPRSELFSF